jgi:hypothetical protein
MQRSSVRSRGAPDGFVGTVHPAYRYGSIISLEPLVSVGTRELGLRPKMSRRWVAAKTATLSRNAATASLVTYNILADGERLALSPKHDYCERELREWGDGRQGRCARLVAEISGYEADIVCLQECSARAFVQVVDVSHSCCLPSHPEHGS